MWCLITVNHSHIHSSKQDDPGIATQPKSQRCLPGESVTFRIEARGATRLTFSWLHGDCVLSGVDGPILTLTDVSDRDSGIYMCEVLNESGKVSSEEVELEIGRFFRNMHIHRECLRVG